MRKSQYVIFQCCFFLFLTCLIGCEGSQASKNAEDIVRNEAIEKPQPSKVDSLAFGQDIFIAGKLISTMCYGRNEPDESDECAVENTKKGLPVAVFENGKSVKESWILLISPQIFSDYMNQRVRVRGVVRGAGVLMPVRVEIETETGWMFIM